MSDEGTNKSGNRVHITPRMSSDKEYTSRRNRSRSRSNSRNRSRDYSRSHRHHSRHYNDHSGHRDQDRYSRSQRSHKEHHGRDHSLESRRHRHRSRSKKHHRHHRSRSPGEQTSNAAISSENEHRSRRKRSKDRKSKRKAKKDAAETQEVSWGEYGILYETDIYNKEPEFSAWLLDIKGLHIEEITPSETKRQFKSFMEDYNTATLPHKKYYDLASWESKNKDKDDSEKGAKNKGLYEPGVLNIMDFV